MNKHLRPSFSNPRFFNRGLRILWPVAIITLIACQPPAAQRSGENALRITKLSGLRQVLPVAGENKMTPLSDVGAFSIDIAVIGKDQAFSPGSSRTLRAFLVISGKGNLSSLDGEQLIEEDMFVTLPPLHKVEIRPTQNHPLRMLLFYSVM